MNIQTEIYLEKVEKIEKDKEIELLFLNYIKYSITHKFLPEDISNIPRKKLLKMDKINDKFQSIMIDLFEMLSSRYDVNVDFNTHDNLANKFVILISDYYDSKYSFKEILDKTEKNLPNNITTPKDFFNYLVKHMGETMSIFYKYKL